MHNLGYIPSVFLRCSAKYAFPHKHYASFASSFLYFVPLLFLHQFLDQMYYYNWALLSKTHKSLAHTRNSETVLAPLRPQVDQETATSRKYAISRVFLRLTAGLRS